MIASSDNRSIATTAPPPPLPHSGKMEAFGGEVLGPAWQNRSLGARVSPTAEVRL